MPSSSRSSKSRSRSASPKRENKTKARTPLSDFLDTWMGEGFSELRVWNGRLEGTLLFWKTWETNLADWLEEHSVEWEKMTYADVLGFFIHRALLSDDVTYDKHARLNSGSYHAQALLNKITLLRIWHRDAELVAIFTRINELNVFDGIRKETSKRFAKKLARYTTAAVSWWTWNDGAFTVNYEAKLVDPIGISVLEKIEYEFRFLLKTD